MKRAIGKHVSWPEASGLRMGPVAALLAGLLAVSACAMPVPTPGPTSTLQPTQIPSPTVSCGDLAVTDCPAAAAAALTSAASRNGTPIRVDLGRGVWCPTPGLLFADTMCPGGSLPPPEGGQWIGHALVTFAGSPAQGYINIAKNGQTVRGEFITLATPPPATPSPS
jgi:hypothetical protein